MLGRGSPANVGRREERGDENPGIIKNVVGPHRVDGRSDIRTPAHTPQPTLLSPARQALGGCGAIELQSAGNVIHVDNVSSRGQYSNQLGATLRKPWWRVLFHMLKFARTINYRVQDNSAQLVSIE
jgi:hypothetical protein